MSQANPDEVALARASAALEDFYRPLEMAPTAARRVGWETDVAHRWRLGAIVDVLAPVGSIDSLLDAGCGEGRLLEVLHAAGFRGAYRGEDLREAPLLRARAAAPPEGLRRPPEYLLAHAFRDAAQCEVVVCSGALNTREG